MYHSKNDKSFIKYDLIGDICESQRLFNNKIFINVVE